MLSWRGPKHPNAGGAEISTHEHAKGWVVAGHNVVLFTSAFRGGREEEIIAGVKIKRKGKQIFGVQWEALKWYLFGRHQKFDLVVDQFHGLPFFTPLYVRAKKMAFIHEATKEVWRLNPWPFPFNLIPYILGTIFEPMIFKLYCHVPFMTVSNSTKDDLVNWGIPRKLITVVHNGVRIPSIKSIKKENKKTLIFLGALSKDKGIEDAIKAFSLISKKDSSWQFWIVGAVFKGYLYKLKELSKKLGIKNRVKFWGYISEQKKFKLLSRAHLAINPSVREGWGLVVIEAASVGLPTVGYNVAGLKDSIINDSTGILCDPNPIDCSSSILSLMSDMKKYERLRKNCLKWSKNFSWEKSSKESLKLVNEIYEKS